METESNQIRWIQSISFFSRFIEETASPFLFCSSNDKHTESLMMTDDLTCHRLEAEEDEERGRRIRCLKINDLQLRLTSFSLPQSLSLSLHQRQYRHIYIQSRKSVVHRWASRPLNAITILISEDDYRVERGEPIRTIKITTVSTHQRQWIHCIYTLIPRRY